MQSILTRFETKNNRSLPANNMVVDTDSDQLLRKTHADGKYIDVTYDPEGNVSKKTYMWSSSDMDRTLGYGYNYQGQLQVVSENGQILAQYGYDHKRQRIYSKTSSVPYPEKYYYWNHSGQVVGEGITGQYGTEYSVRYFYSGNEKIAMERRDILTGDTRLYYFVNNAQGTPVLIVDSTNNDAVSRINLDEYGNIGSMIGAKEEINFTGKKMDLKTGLYYFNQRYYDPELGRFLQEDPAAQGPNLYQYCGNNPLMYTDPDGQWFFTALTTMFGMPWLGAMLDSAAWAGTTSAAINAGAQYAMTGSINMGSVWNSFGSGALSGGLSYGVGHLSGLTGIAKDIGHGISGGLQSMANGGNFGSGFAGGFVGSVAGGMSEGQGMFERAGIAGLAAGTTSWATGGDFATGFQSGFSKVLYNDFGETTSKMMGDYLSRELNGYKQYFANINRWLSDRHISIGISSEYGMVNKSISIGQGKHFSTNKQTPNLGSNVYITYNPENLPYSGTLAKYGVGLGTYKGKNGPSGFVASFGMSVLPVTFYKSWR